MKFLVLALCVCAASAATFGQYKPVKNAAKVAGSPFGGASSSRFAPAPPAPAVVSPVSVSAAASGPVAKTANNDAEAEVISNVSEVLPDGSYKQSFETNNGIAVESTGTLKQVGETSTYVVTGSYKYYDNEGNPVEVTYVADENGYQAKSDSIPVGPPVPEAIARAVEYVLKYGKPEKPQEY